MKAANAISMSINFQFPLLGIFPCTEGKKAVLRGADLRLSIPSTWDFSMHPSMGECSEHEEQYRLSIPSTWDFSMHHKSMESFVFLLSLTFNSLYLGFFHAPNVDPTIHR
jgi:hypothetical protein